MKRKKKIILVAHCLLNINAKVYGISTEPAAAKDFIGQLLKKEMGIIQLPCVEMDMCGVNRWGQVKSQLNHPHFHERCKELLLPIVYQVEDYYKNGYEICGVVGADGSPSCGVNYTCAGEWYGEIGEDYNTMEKAATVKMIKEKGVMMDILQEMLNEKGLDIPCMALDESDFSKIFSV